MRKKTFGVLVMTEANNVTCARRGVIFELAHCFATGFYSGYFPWAPGTAGTITALILLFALHGFFPQAMEPSFGVALAATVTLLGIVSANYVCRSGHFGANKDPKQIVIDEFAGFYVAVIALDSITALTLAFVWFRVFDILKPPPVRNLEKLPEGYGIILDDVAAGLFAAVVTRICMAAIILSASGS